MNSSKVEVVLVLLRRIVLGACLGSSLIACGVLKEKQKSEIPYQEIARQKLTPEQSKVLLGEIGNSWLYGDGIGKATATIGSIALFPPYALWVLANSVISLSGYEELSLLEVLPKEEKQEARALYSSVVSSPGRVAAALAGKEYRSKAVIKARMEQFIEELREENERTSKVAHSDVNFPRSTGHSQHYAEGENYSAG